MKTLEFTDFPKLLADFDQRLIDLDLKEASYSTLCVLMKEWYNIDPIVDDIGSKATFTLPDTTDSTMFVLKWS